jgi:hypothetical protein
MTFRTPLAALALALVATAAPSASAQQVVYYQPACQPVVYHQPVYTYAPPVVYMTSSAVSQSGPWVNRPIFISPPSYSVGRTYRAGPYTKSFGGPFNRPSLNLAYKLAW